MSTSATHITVRAPLAIRRRPGRKTVVVPVPDSGATAVPTRADPALVKAFARAFRYQRLLDEGRYAGVSEMAAAERVERGYMGTLLRLTLLSPDVVEAILDGRHPDALMLPRLMESFPTSWAEQRVLFGISTGHVTGARRELHHFNPQRAASRQQQRASRILRR
jgi:hypothetical protein